MVPFVSVPLWLTNLICDWTKKKGYTKMNKKTKNKVAKLTTYSELENLSLRIGYYDMDEPFAIHQTGVLLAMLKVGRIKLDDIIKDIMNKGYDEVIVPKDMIVK